MTQYALINTDDEFGVAPVIEIEGDGDIACGMWMATTSGQEISPSWSFYFPSEYTFLCALDMFLLVPTWPINSK
jgi:hypothetical protein